MANPGQSTATAARILFRLPDPDGRWRAVRLQQEIGVPGNRLHFARQGDDWVLGVDPPAVQRLEYAFEVTGHDGGSETILDPGNPKRAPGAFGDKSVLELPDYRPPDWLALESPPGRRRPLTIATPALAESVSGELWEPDDLSEEEPAPLLVAHDGPEFDALGGLTRFVSASIAAGVVPPARVALLSPGPRDSWYSANTHYARALSRRVLPEIERHAPATVRVGLGASLGGLALLDAQRRFPETFGGLFLQSPSFFHPRFDAHEARFAHYRRIVRFVGEVRRGGEGNGLPVVVTCGAVEENLENNRLLASTLAEQGHDVEMVVVVDAHNYIAWRDCWDPHLAALLRRAAGRR